MRKSKSSIGNSRFVVKPKEKMELFVFLKPKHRYIQKYEQMGNTKKKREEGSERNKKKKKVILVKRQPF